MSEKLHRKKTLRSVVFADFCCFSVAPAKSLKTNPDTFCQQYTAYS